MGGEYDYEYKNTSVGQELSPNTTNDCWFYEYVLPNGLGGRKECKIGILDFSLKGTFDDFSLKEPVDNFVIPNNQMIHQKINNNFKCNNEDEHITFEPIDSTSKDIVPIIDTKGQLNTCYFCESIKSLKVKQDPLTREPFSSENKKRIRYYCNYEI
jgi:hypothetical protein